MALVVIAATGCADRGVTPERATTVDSVDQIITGMDRTINRDGIRVSDVKADSAWMYDGPQVALMKGVTLVFYDSSGAVRSTVTADSGRHEIRTGLLDVRGNVVATTPAPDSKVLKTEHLIFDKASNLIRSDTSYTFTSAQGNGSGQSFETDTDFRQFRSWQPKGVQKGKGFLLPGQQKEPADS